MLKKYIIIIALCFNYFVVGLYAENKDVVNDDTEIEEQGIEENDSNIQEIVSNEDSGGIEDSKSDIDTDLDLDYIYDRLYINSEQDIFRGEIIKGYEPSEEYMQNLQYNKYIDLFYNNFTGYKIRRNINILPFFPFTFIPFGGLSLVIGNVYAKGIDIGIYYETDRMFNENIRFSLLSHMVQNNRFRSSAGIDVLKVHGLNRLSLFFNTSLFTTAVGFETARGLYDPSVNVLGKMFNMIWDMTGITFPMYSDTGFNFVTGVQYRIPIVELLSRTAFSINYSYTDSKITEDPLLFYSSSKKANLESPGIELVDMSNLYFTFSEKLIFDKSEQTDNIIEGEIATVDMEFFIPTGVGDFGDEFRFKFHFENIYNKKVFREFAVRTRLLGVINYNYNEDFSGDGFVRGVAPYQLTGFAGLIGNLEVYIPAVKIKLLKGADFSIDNRPALFTIYAVLFTDGGFTVHNDEYVTGDYYSLIENSYLKEDFYLDEDSKFRIIPAWTFGGGFRIVPSFLHFMVRFDVGVNILEYILTEKGPGVEIVLSFNDMF